MIHGDLAMCPIPALFSFELQKVRRYYIPIFFSYLDASARLFPYRNYQATDWVVAHAATSANAFPHVSMKMRQAFVKRRSQYH